MIYNGFMITTKKYVITIVVLVLLCGATFGLGLNMGAKGYVYQGHNFQIINQNNAPKNVDYNLLWQALDILNQNYIDKPVDQQKILYGAVQGAIAAVGDPYTEFFDPTAYKDFETSLSGSFEGIGAEVTLNNGAVQIVSTLDGSPAKQAGLLAGDYILKIDGQDATKMTLDEAVNKIRGPKGTQVHLTILRGSQQKDITITRNTINVASVKYSTINKNGKTFEDINILEFGDDTVNLFAQAATDAQSKHVSGIILDLRDDPGGYLDDAVKIASYWVNKGDVVVSEAHSDGTTQTYTALGNNVLHDIPTVVLINGGTASAAEILSGALRDHGFAKLIGEKSFGKGSVQQLFNLPDNTAMKVTIAKWLTPNGQNLNHNGLDPDIKVALTAENIKNNQDPQMDAAVAQLLK